MTSIPVSATTVTYVEPSINSAKFYRCYALDVYEIRQWGRLGSLGQFDVRSHPNARTAAQSAAAQINAKQRKGYGDPTVTDFAFDLTKFDPKRPEILARVREAAEAKGGNREAGESERRGTATATSARTVVKQVEVDVFDAFAQRAMEAITASVTDPTQAAVTLATLNSEWEPLQTSVDRARSYLDTLTTLVGAV